MTINLSAVYDWPGWTPKSHLPRRLLAAQMIWTLKLDGPVDGPNAMILLGERLRARGVEPPPLVKGPGGNNPLTKIALVLSGQSRAATGGGNLVPTPVLRRGLKGRSTVHLSVLDGADLPPNPFPPDPVEVPEPEPPAEVKAPEPEPVEPARNGHRPEPIIVKTPTDKALLILRLAGELALDTAAMPVPTTHEDSERLADALAEAERLRRRLAEESTNRAAAEEGVISQRRVIDALKAQRDILQSNLDAAMRKERRPDDTGRRALDRMMREPTTR